MTQAAEGPAAEDASAADDGAEPPLSAYGIALDTPLLRASVETPLVGEELVVLRSTLMKLLREHPGDLKLIRDNVHEIVQTLKIAHGLDARLAREFDDAMDASLKQITEQLFGDEPLEFSSQV